MKYVYKRELRELNSQHGDKIWVVLARSSTASSLQEKDGVIRVDDYVQSCALTSDGKVGSKGKRRKTGHIVENRIAACNDMS